MKIFGRDTDHEIAVIAEIGVNHEGNVEAAAALVRAAAAAGADAVKFQSYTPHRFISPADAERFARVTRFGLDEAAHRHLADVARQAGIVFFSAAISEDWVDLIAELSPVIKIASGDLSFEKVIRSAAATGRQVIVSTGCGSVEDVDQAVSWVKDEIGPAALKDRLALLHCISVYPAPVEQTNLRSIPFMAERYGLTTGWSNHVIGPDACLAAVALGAKIVEVHVTDRREGRTFRDHELSFEPNELADLVVRLRQVASALGRAGKFVAPVEEAMRPAIRKGLVAARDLPAGTIIQDADVIFARPNGAFGAAGLSQIIGRRLNTSVHAYAPFTPEVFGDA